MRVLAGYAPGLFSLFHKLTNNIYTGQNKMAGASTQGPQPHNGYGNPGVRLVGGACEELQVGGG